MTDGPIAITGARGRLGRALVGALSDRSDVLRWSRPQYELDEPARAESLIRDQRPGLVIHTAAMTDVDGCATDPAAAMRRNADAVGALARSCRAAGSRLLIISTNEVFDGKRRDRRGYIETDEPRPGNAYGRSKLAGEEQAREAFDDGEGLWIVRTAWLFGPPGGDFPDKIVAAADQLGPDEALPVVDDEHGSPTYTIDLAGGLLELISATAGGLFHLVGGGHASRHEWARRVLSIRRPGRAVRAISQRQFPRPSTPPPWGVLDPARARAAGVGLPPWTDAVDRAESERA